MLKFLANENIPAEIIAELSKSYDIISISQENPGISDKQVMQMAQEQNRYILTFDRNYGDLVYHQLLESPPAIIY